MGTRAVEIDNKGDVHYLGFHIVFLPSHPDDYITEWHVRNYHLGVYRHCRTLAEALAFADAITKGNHNRSRARDRAGARAT